MENTTPKRFTAVNEHTGKLIMSKSSKQYEDNYDMIFRNKEIKEKEENDDTEK